MRGTKRVQPRRQRTLRLIDSLTYLSLVPLLFIMLGTTLLAGGLASVKLVTRLAEIRAEPTARPITRRVVRPTVALSVSPTSSLTGPVSAAETTAPAGQAQTLPPPLNGAEMVVEAAYVVETITPGPIGSPEQVISPPSLTALPIPSLTATVVAPTATPRPPTTPARPATAAPAVVPAQNRAAAGQSASPTNTPAPTFTPVPDYDFMLAEFFNSPTTNSFMLIYVAIVDPKEIPIGDMKIVGTRLDHNLTYESPLSTWHYEGSSAPGELIKTGNVKFEPPGGLETTAWLLHLEDGHGQRQSEDIPFNVDEDNKQWYFIKFRRKY